MKKCKAQALIRVIVLYESKYKAPRSFDMLYRRKSSKRKGSNFTLLQRARYDLVNS